jgi:hypothetical protein
MMVLQGEPDPASAMQTAPARARGFALQAQLSATIGRVSAFLDGVACALVGAEEETPDV